MAIAELSIILYYCYFLVLQGVRATSNIFQTLNKYNLVILALREKGGLQHGTESIIECISNDLLLTQGRTMNL